MSMTASAKRWDRSGPTRLAAGVLDPLDQGRVEAREGIGAQQVADEGGVQHEALEGGVARDSHVDDGHGGGRGSQELGRGGSLRLYGTGPELRAAPVPTFINDLAGFVIAQIRDMPAACLKDPSSTRRPPRQSGAPPRWCRSSAFPSRHPCPRRERSWSWWRASGRGSNSDPQSSPGAQRHGIVVAVELRHPASGQRCSRRSAPRQRTAAQASMRSVCRLGE